MTYQQFTKLESLVRPVVEKICTNWREPISVAERLAVTLRYLATGNSFRSLSFSFRIGRSTTAQIVHETCDALWSVLSGTYMKAPQANEEWQKIAQDFEDKWNFPNCLGAIDGKHVHIKCPSNTGSQFYNYKGTFSVVLMAVADARYRFSLIDVGSSGRQSDGGISGSSPLGIALSNNTMRLPDDRVVAQGDPPLPYVFVGDAAFPLRRHLMRPFPGKNLPEDRRIFNYRLSRARRVVENAFGILCQRFRIFLKPIEVSVDHVDAIVKAACCLHNFLMSGEGSVGTASAPEPTASPLMGLPRIGGNASGAAVATRYNFAKYFATGGAVPWQWDAC